MPADTLSPCEKRGRLGIAILAGGATLKSKALPASSPATAWPRSICSRGCRTTSELGSNA